MRLLSSTLLVFFLALPSFAGTNNRRHLGSTDFWNSSSVKIPVKSCKKYDEKITHFLARVSYDHVYVRDTTLHYADGTTTYFWVDGWLYPGYVSRWLPVTEEGKCLKFITVRGHRNGNYGNGLLQFYGYMVENEGEKI